MVAAGGLRYGGPWTIVAENPRPTALIRRGGLRCGGRGRGGPRTAAPPPSTRQVTERMKGSTVKPAHNDRFHNDNVDLTLRIATPGRFVWENNDKTSNLANGIIVIFLTPVTPVPYVNIVKIWLYFDQNPESAGTIGRYLRYFLLVLFKIGIKCATSTETHIFT